MLKEALCLLVACCSTSALASKKGYSLLPVHPSPDSASDPLSCGASILPHSPSSVSLQSGILTITNQIVVDQAFVNKYIEPSMQCLVDELHLSNTEGIAENAFSRFLALKKVIFPTTLRFIGQKAFYECPSLHEVIFLEPTTSSSSHQVNIGPSAFANCTSLEKLQLPSLMVHEFAFSGCSSLNEVIFTAGGPADSITIGPSAFGLCLELRKISVKNPIKEFHILQGGFRKCPKLEEIALGQTQELHIAREDFNSEKTGPKVMRSQGTSLTVVRYQNGGVYNTKHITPAPEEAHS